MRYGLFLCGNFMIMWRSFAQWSHFPAGCWEEWLQIQEWGGWPWNLEVLGGRNNSQDWRKPIWSNFCPILECCPLGPLELLPHWGVCWVSQTPAKKQLTHTFCFFFSNVLGWRDIRPAQVFWLALNSLCQKAPTLFRMERDALLTVLKTSVAGHWLRSELKSRCKISLTWQDLATAREIRSMWLPAGAAAAGSHWCESLHLTGQ